MPKTIVTKNQTPAPYSSRSTSQKRVIMSSRQSPSVVAAKCHWLRLPEEVQIATLKAADLNPLELTRLRLVSTSFDKLIDAPILWRNFCPPNVFDNTSPYQELAVPTAGFQQRLCNFSRPMQVVLRQIWDRSPRCLWDSHASEWRHCTHSEDFQKKHLGRTPFDAAHGKRLSWRQLEQSYDIHLAALGHPEVLGYSSLGKHNDADPNFMRQYIKSRPGHLLKEKPKLISMIPTSLLAHEVMSANHSYKYLFQICIRHGDKNDILRLCQLIFDLEGSLGEWRPPITAKMLGAKYKTSSASHRRVSPWQRTLSRLYSSDSDFFRSLYAIDPKVYLFFPEKYALSAQELQRLVSTTPEVYPYLSLEFSENLKLAEIAVAGASTNMFCVSAELLSRHTFVQAMIEHWSVKGSRDDIDNILMSTAPTYRDSFLTASMVLARHGSLLSKFSAAVRGDFGMVKLAIQSDVTAMRFASPVVHNNIETMGELVSTNPYIFPFLRSDLRSRPDVRCSTATAFLRKMKPDVAQTMFREILTEYPRYPEARFGLDLAESLIRLKSTAQRPATKDTFSISSTEA